MSNEPFIEPHPAPAYDAPIASGRLIRERLYRGLVTAVRLLLGTDLLVNGVNWWVKLIGPYPSLSDYAHHAPPPDFVGAMIQTGIIFHIVKATELLTGLALLTNRFVPLMLVVVFPITVPVFAVDDLISHHLRAKVMGTGALLMNSFLILAYLNHYLSVLVARGTPDTLADYGAPAAADPAVGTGLLARSLSRILPLYGAIAALFGVAMVSWVAVMIVQFFAR